MKKSTAQEIEGNVARSLSFGINMSELGDIDIKGNRVIYTEPPSPLKTTAFTKPSIWLRFREWLENHT